MANFKCDSIELEIPDDKLPIVKDWITSRDNKINDLTLKNDSINKQLEAAIAKNEALQIQNDSINKELEVVKTTHNDSVLLTNLKERRKLERLAEPILAKVNPKFHADSFDSLTDREIKESIVKLQLPSLTAVKNDSIGTCSDEVVNSYFEVAVTTTNTTTHTDSTKPLQTLLGNIVHTDSVHNDAVENARKEAKEERENAWKKTLEGAR